MDILKIQRKLAARLEEAAPSSMPKSTMGIAGGHIDWDQFAEAILDAMEELIDENSEGKAGEEVRLTRVEESGHGGADT